MTVRERVREFVSSHFYTAGNSVGDDASLFEQGIVDSTGVLEVVSFLEHSFSIRVADEEMVPENLETIERIAAFVIRKANR